ncbi:hypothetical protein AB6A40_000235 [Gnathostoma spinigerum]|uniref:Palmitoyltransferase n=1 Tax=Gnathostoma spinigerum TaxID=75299 RepID=A0ABD6E834_9BILA
MIFRFDPCGILCAFFTYLSMIYADYVVINWLVIPSFPQSLWGVFHAVLFNTVLFFAFVSHARAMLTDPGLVPVTKNTGKNRRIPERYIDDSDQDNSDESDVARQAMINTKYVGEDWSVCTRCESFRPPRAHHCRICRRCVRKMDHHCPWVNNCVGEFNQKFFLQFLLYVGIASFYAILLIVVCWAYHNGVEAQKNPHLQTIQHTKLLHTIFLSVESVLFGLFVVAVACDQLQAIFNDETAVEAVQRRGLNYKYRRRSKMSMMKEVCGSDSLISWFLPCSTLPVTKEVVEFPRKSSIEV